MMPRPKPAVMPSSVDRRVSKTAKPALRSNCACAAGFSANSRCRVVSAMLSSVARVSAGVASPRARSTAEATDWSTARAVFCTAVPA